MCLALALSKAGSLRFVMIAELAKLEPEHDEEWLAVDRRQGATALWEREFGAGSASSSRCETARTQLSLLPVLTTNQDHPTLHQTPLRLKKFSMSCSNVFTFIV
jgi:hypothetical protein